MIQDRSCAGQRGKLLKALESLCVGKFALVSKIMDDIEGEAGKDGGFIWQWVMAQGDPGQRSSGS